MFYAALMHYSLAYSILGLANSSDHYDENPLPENNLKIFGTVDSSSAIFISLLVTDFVLLESSNYSNLKFLSYGKN